ncbi:hypothetical protein HZA85_02760 [Candidatus Uhrbacteria bacterium]|nr:hypothetical protein [Candidatus Uhrbacteria bacterium]
MPRLFVSMLVFFSLLLVLRPVETRAKIIQNDFVRTANIYLMSGPVLDSNRESLSHFDLIVIPIEAQVYNPSFFSNIRKLNPDIIILPYIATVSWNDLYWTDPLHQAMSANIQSDWWLKDAGGKQISVWPNTRALNLNTGWIDYLSAHVKNDVLSTGYWDGIFYDEVQDSISWVGNVDVNRDGINDTAPEANALWAQRYKTLFEKTRSLIGQDSILLTNGSSNPAFSSFVDGRMFETFPSSHNTLAEWKDKASQYVSIENTIPNPVVIVNVNTDNTGGVGTQQDYQAMRFGLATTLLANGYFSYDHGSGDHAVIWSYDEYQAFLGMPKGAPINTFNPQQATLDTGIWQRDFTQGKVIVNATNHAYTVNLSGEFEKIHGVQDPITNDGSVVSEVTVPAKDGLLLLRPIEEIKDTTFLNGSFARIFSANGVQKRTGFFAYDSAYRGGTQVVHYDLDDDGMRESVVANETHVWIYNADGTLHTTFDPYGSTYRKGINIAIGDLENDGSVEIVTGTENGGGPHIRVFNKDGVLINPGFFAYAKNFRGGVNVAVGDLNGDGIKEIIAGAGYGGGPHIRVYKKDGTLINPGFFAYDPNFRGGVNVASADVDGDGVDEVITGPGLGGPPLARIYDRDGKKKAEFYAYDKKQKRGLEIVAADLDHDGKAEVIGLTTDVFTLSGFGP